MCNKQLFLILLLCNLINNTVKLLPLTSSYIYMSPLELQFFLFSKRKSNLGNTANQSHTSNFFRQMTTAIAIEDVRREVRILSSLAGHSNLVQFYDAYEDEENVYIVME